MALSTDPCGTFGGKILTRRFQQSSALGFPHAGLLSRLGGKSGPARIRPGRMNTNRQQCWMLWEIILLPQ
jgi:hypothetical protein